jgi:hypothetical protein
MHFEDNKIYERKNLNVFVRSLFHLLELLFCEVGHRVYANLENKHEN